MAETRVTEDDYTWRETAPLTLEGYEALFKLSQRKLQELADEGWFSAHFAFRAYPSIEPVRDFELDIGYYECRFRICRGAEYLRIRRMYDDI